MESDNELKFRPVAAVAELADALDQIFHSRMTLETP